MPNDQFHPHTLAGREYGLRHGVTSAEAHKRIHQAIQLVQYFCGPDLALEIDHKIADWQPFEPQEPEPENAETPRPPGPQRKEKPPTKTPKGTEPKS